MLSAITVRIAQPLDRPDGTRGPGRRDRTPQTDMKIMGDLTFIAVTLLFFAVSAGFIAALNRL
jgi:hypothetical protein